MTYHFNIVSLMTSFCCDIYNFQNIFFSILTNWLAQLHVLYTMSDMWQSKCVMLKTVFFFTESF